MSDYLSQHTGAQIDDAVQKVLDATSNAGVVDFGSRAVIGQVKGLGYCPSISSGADLNSYTTPGVFAVGNNTIAASLSNCPSQMGGRLTVVSALGSRYADSAQYIYLRQIYERYDGVVYERYADSSSGFSGLVWRDWSLIYGVDAVVEQGTSGIWTYRKWSNGIAECWGTVGGSVTFSASGSMYRGALSNTGFPFTFTSAPIAVATHCNSDGAYYWCTPINIAATTTGIGAITLIRETSAGSSAVQVRVAVLVKGRWK